MRNVETSKTPVQTTHNGFQFRQVTQNAWLSGFDIQTNDSPNASDDVYGVFAGGDGTFSVFVEDMVLVTEDGAEILTSTLPRDGRGLGRLVGQPAGN